MSCLRGLESLKPSSGDGEFLGADAQEIADADWIASGAVFLACEDSRYMTGQSLTIDGGYVMDGSLPSAEYCKE